MTPDLAEAFEAYVDRVRARMEAGAKTYGDTSLRRPRAELLTEIQEELEDVAGWAALLWFRLERLRPGIEAAEEESP